MNTYYDTATQLFQQGEYKKAIKILEQLTKDFPDILMFKNLLGISYLKNKNTGKAITIFENLITIQPNNASFIAHLADAYLLRGWHNKAIDLLNNNIMVDENTILKWIELTKTYIESSNIIETKKIFNELLQQTVEKNDNLAISIYFHLLIIDIYNEDFESTKKILENLSIITLKSEEYRDLIASVLLKVTEYFVQAHMFEAANEILDKTDLISPNNEKVKTLKVDINNFLTPKEEPLQFVPSRFNWFNNYSNNSSNLQKPYVRKKPRIGRNAPCPCGSEKKYKKCCG